MNIQAKFAEIREATENAKRMIEGLSALGETIFPEEKLKHRISDGMEIHYKAIENDLTTQRSELSATIERCEQMTNEVMQLANSITARYETRFRALETDMAEMKDMLQGFVEAASRRRK